MCTYFKTETDVAQIWSMIFFLTLNVRVPFHRKDFNWKKMGCTGIHSEKAKPMHAELKERAEAATSSYSAAVDFYNTFIRYLWLRIIRRSSQGVQFMNFPWQRFFIMVTELLYWRKVLCGCFRIIWLWLLIAVMNDAHCNFIVPPWAMLPVFALSFT